MNELREFPRPVLEALRQPLEDGVGSGGRAHFPPRFRLVATAKRYIASDLEVNG